MVTGTAVAVAVAVGVGGWWVAVAVGTAVWVAVAVGSVVAVGWGDGVIEGSGAAVGTAVGIDGSAPFASAAGTGCPAPVMASTMMIAMMVSNRALIYPLAFVCVVLVITG